MYILRQLFEAIGASDRLMTGLVATITTHSGPGPGRTALVEERGFLACWLGAELWRMGVGIDTAKAAARVVDQTDLDKALGAGRRYLVAAGSEAAIVDEAGLPDWCGRGCITLDLQHRRRVLHQYIQTIPREGRTRPHLKPF